MAKALTKIALDALNVAGRVSDGAVQGLYFQVTLGKDGSPRKSAVLRYKIAGRARELGCGAYPAVSLAAIRERAREARASISKGEDPLAQKAAAKEAREQAAIEAQGVKTFQQVAEDFLTKHIKPKRALCTIRDHESTLARFAYPVIGKMNVAEIKVRHIHSILEPLSLVRNSNAKAGLGGLSVARNLRSRLEAILTHAGLADYRDIDLPNPASPKFFKKLLGEGPETQHHRAAPLADVPAIFARLGEEGGTVANAIRFVMLSACRLNEILGARFDEIEGDKLVISAARTKRRRAHSIPLTGEMRAIIDQQAAKRSGPFIFPSLRFPKQPMAGSTPAALLARLGFGESTTLHGFRSSFRDWAKRSKIDNDVAELVIGHRISSDKTVTAYLRDELIEDRLIALQRWGDFLAGKEPQDNVISLPGFKLAKGAGK